MHKETENGKNFEGSRMFKADFDKSTSYVLVLTVKLGTKFYQNLPSFVM